MRAAPSLLLVLVPLLAGCTAPAAELHARPGDFAVVDLQAFDAQGRSVLNVTAQRAVLAAEVPVRLPEGWDTNRTFPLPAGVRDALLGAAPGSARDTPLLPPEQGFGPWRADKTITMPLRMNLSRVLHVPASALQAREADPRCDACGVGVAYTLRWANVTWDVRVLGGNGTTQDVLLASTPPNGTLLELPDVWNAQVHLWQSRLVGSDAANLSLEQEVRPSLGSTVLVGGQPYRVRVDNGTAIADGNPPLARTAVRFHVLLRELAFAGSAAFPRAPDAVLVDVDGTRFNLSDLRGQPVLLDFFATWCVTCKQQAPALAQVHAALPGVRIVSITIDPTDTPDKVLAFRQDAARAGLPTDWTWAFDPTGAAARGFGVTGIPRQAVLDADLRIRATSAGFHSAEEMRAQLAASG